jgi:putative hemolysin
LYLERPHGLLLAASTGVALTVFSSGVILANATHGSILMLLVDGLLFALVLLVVGQLVPRAVAKRWAPQLIPVLLPPLQALEMVLNPALRLVRRLAGDRNGAATSPPPTDEETLEELLREGELEGVGEAGEIAIISGVVQFGEKRVRDVMVPAPISLRSAGHARRRDGRSRRAIGIQQGAGVQRLAGSHRRHGPWVRLAEERRD